MPGHVCKAGNRTPRIIIIIIVKTGLETSRDQDSSLENSKSGRE